MSQGGFNTFELVVNYINKKWKNVMSCLGFLKFMNIGGYHELLDKVIAYVENEGANLNTFTWP
jgi:hypothetical protein